MSDKTCAKILVVDDEPAIRELLVDALSDDRLEITTASSGAEAIEIARREDIDFVITDLQLGDCTGLDVLDTLRRNQCDIPAVIMTGYGDIQSFSRASQFRPVELMTKPLDVEHLRTTIHNELARREQSNKWRHRTVQLRRIARKLNSKHKNVQRKLDTTCEDLTEAYRALAGQLSGQEALLRYQNELIAANNNDEVFRCLFNLMVHRSGGIYGIAFATNPDDELQIVGRFGVPQPDSLEFCRKISAPVIETVQANPQTLMFDATDETEPFDESIHKYLVGVTILAVPLVTQDGDVNGLVVFYRKGEQPFTEDDVRLAESAATATGTAVAKHLDHPGYPDYPDSQAA